MEDDSKRVLERPFGMCPISPLFNTLMNANPLTFIVAVANLLAGSWHVAKGEWKMAIVWLAYCVAAVTLAFVK